MADIRRLQRAIRSFAQPSRRAAAALSVALALHAALAQAQAPAQQSFFAPACAHLPALQRSTPNGPEDESLSDTARIQRALDLCPAGHAVELEPAATDGPTRNAFLIAPVRLPPGVTLLIDAGVTVFASRRAADYRDPAAQSFTDQQPCGDLPCLPLLRAAAAGTGDSSAVEGFGSIDGRGRQTLLDANTGNLAWADLPRAQRPVLIQSSGSFNLRGLLLRDAPGITLESSGSGAITLARVTLLAQLPDTTFPGIVLGSDQLTLAISESTFAPANPNAVVVAHSNPSLAGGRNTPGYAPDIANDVCDSIGGSTGLAYRSAAQTAQFLGSGAVFLSDLHASNLALSNPQPGLTIHAVVSPTQPGLPTPRGTITFLDNGNVLGTAELEDGIASLPLPPLDPGLTHRLTARDSSGLLAFGSSHSLVQTSVTTLSLASNFTHATYGTALDLTASSAPTSATGTVSFLDGTSVLGQSSLSSGSATFTTSQLTPGTHTLAAQYAGDSADSSAASPPLTVRIDPAQSTVSLTGVPGSALYGTALHLSATITPSAATGSITFLDQATTNGQSSSSTLGQVSLASGSAALTLANLPAGQHILSATYSGDGNDAAATSATAILTIQPLPTSAALVASAGSVPYASPVTFSATLSPATASGSIVFADSVSGTLGQATVANGSATLTVQSLAPGPHSISAAYTGDATHAATVSPATLLNITRRPAGLTLAPVATSLSAGLPLRLVASVLPASATGVVTFAIPGGVTLAQAPVVAGIATAELNSLAPGTYTVTAAYSGDQYTLAALSTPQTVQVLAGSTTVSLNPSFDSAPYGSSLTLAATVLPATLTGIVTFSDEQLGPLGSAALINGSASLPVSGFEVGTHTLLATFSGNAPGSSAVSPARQITISAASTTTTLRLAQADVPADAPVLCNVEVQTAPGVPVTGNVQIVSGTRLLTSAPLQPAASGVAFLTLSLPAGVLGVGSFPVAALYSGDRHNAPSSSGPGPLLTITPIPTAATLSISTTQIALHTPVLLSVQVSASRGAPPTGSVSFLDDGAAIVSVPLTPAGTASLTYTPTRLGSHALSAIYQPSNSFAPATAAFQPLVVTQPVALTLAPSTLSATTNSTHTVDLSLTPLSGFSGTIQATCSSSASFISCTVSAPATLNAPTHASVSITVAPDLSAHALLDPPHDLPPVAYLACLLPLLLLSRAKRPLQSVRLLTSLAASVLLAGSLLGCALGGNFFAVPAGPQTVVVQITAAGTPVTSSLTLNITP